MMIKNENLSIKFTYIVVPLEQQHQFGERRGRGNVQIKREKKVRRKGEKKKKRKKEVKYNI